jgi:predicted mannosyl-3-phosphoglycerate phosphatase (HAD superfamily)
LLRTSIIAFCAVDSLVAATGPVQAGFEEFSAALERANVPLVWVTNRTRLQMDQPRRRLEHSHPFIAEGGCGVYLPDGYFHLPTPKITRFGRFQCLPIAEPQPAASEALETISSDLDVPVVPLGSLSPAEFTRNIGLPQKEAGLARHRDFEELFFFAGAGAEAVQRFLKEAFARKLQVRQQGALWSLAVGANLQQCVAEVFQLYQRSLRSRLISFGIAAAQDDSVELLAACQRGVRFGDPSAEEAAKPTPSSAKVTEMALRADAWERVLSAMNVRT